MVFKLSPAAVLEGARSSTLTYPEVGATAGELPTGYRHMRHRWVIGEGGQTFQQASRVLLGWRMHRGAWLGVWASAPVADLDVVVVLGIGVPPLRVFAPCRVVYEVREERRRGFAYGTLPGHPVCGEEAFVVEDQDDGAVVLDVTAFSRPATWYTRLAVVHMFLQDAITERYASALRRATTRT